MANSREAEARRGAGAWETALAGAARMAGSSSPPACPPTDMGHHLSLEVQLFSRSWRPNHGSLLLTLMLTGLSIVVALCLMHDISVLPTKVISMPSPVALYNLGTNVKGGQSI